MRSTAVLDTSIDAFHAHRCSGKAQAQRERIVRFVSQRGGDWSVGELANALGLEKSAVSARVNEALYETQELVAKPKRKDRISQILVRPVALPAIQRDLFR